MYDVPIMLGFLIASKQVDIRDEKLRETWFVGEIGLDGTVRPVRGMLPIALEAIRVGIKALYVPLGNAHEVAAVADQLCVYAVSSLQELMAHLKEEVVMPDLVSSPLYGCVEGSEEEFAEPSVDFMDIRGHEHAKRALLIAAASSHNVLMVGPPGSGKTLLARALAGILPPLDREESYAVTSLYSIAGILPEGRGLINARPFRSPHHGASSVALVGGGTNPKPGEVSLAHSGVLFLDELPEFSQHTLDQLRQPIEDGLVTVSRASHTITYPARLMLVGAMNPCKCGFLGSEKKSCQCSPGDVLRYQRRVSGPLLDRFDIHLMVNDVPVEELLTEQPSGASSREFAEHVSTARELQIKRQGKLNAKLTPKEMNRYCALDANARKILFQAETRFHLSSRGVHRLLKVARTIADMDAKDKIMSSHLAEALQYREQLQAALPDFV